MFPIKYIDNNLVWNKDNEVFAYYELIPYNYSFLSAEQKFIVHDSFRQLIAQSREGKIHALQIATESSIRSMQEQSKNHSGKGVRLMKPSDFQKTVQCRFESCLKKVVRHVVKDYQQGLKRRKDKEIPFCELPEIFVENFAVRDDYETDYTIFSVCGIDIRVLDDELAEALKKLPERKRNTLLMYYFLEMTESEIANLQKITQSGVFRNRHHALETMKKILKEKQ